MYNRYISDENTYTRVTDEDQDSNGAGTGEAGPEASASPPKEPKYVRAGGPAHNPAGGSNSFFPGGEVLDKLKLGKLGELFDREKSGGMGGLLEALGLEELDSGDILLLLIILFLLLEGDNLDLIITLGLILLLGLSDKKKKPDGGKPSGQGEPGEASGT